MRKGTKVNKKRLIIFVVVIVIIIIAIVLLIKNLNKDKDITLDGTEQITIDSQVAINEQDIEYDGNPYNVPQEYTQTVNEFIGDTGEALDENTLITVKEDIENKFRSISPDKLGINSEMANVKITFNPVTTTIAGKNCLVFAVYEEKDNQSIFISKYAMSVDTSVLYKFNSDTLVYNMIEI